MSHRIRTLAGTAALALALQAGAEELRTEVFNLHYRSAAEVVELLRPLVPAPGVVTGLADKLVVRTSPGNMAELRGVLQALDRAPRQLLITVRHGVDHLGQAAGVDAFVAGDGALRGRAGERRAGRGAVIDLDDGTTRGALRIHSTRRAQSTGDVQRVQVLEGREAFIRSASAVPLREHEVLVEGGRASVIESTRYEDVSSGFYVRPRVSGDEVILDIAPQRERLRRSGDVDHQSAATTVRVRLGEWTELGGTGEVTARTRETIGLSTHSDSRRDQRIFIMVQELP